MVDRGFIPAVIQIVPLSGTIYIEIKRISTIDANIIMLRTF